MLYLTCGAIFHCAKVLVKCLSYKMQPLLE